MQPKSSSKVFWKGTCRRRVAVTWVPVFTSVLVAACSSGPLAPADGAHDAGTLPDGTLDRAASDSFSDSPSDTAADGGPAVDGQTCSPRPVWPPDAEGFTYNQSGGFVAPPPPDAGCSGNFTAYQFSVAGMTLSKHACDFSGRTDLTVQLNQSQALVIVMSLQGLQTSCPGHNCGADAPDVSLTVLASSTPPLTYNGDFYAGCSAAALPPFISYQNLGALGSLLGSIVTSACQQDSGGFDTGSCTHGQDGGSAGGGSDVRACDGTAPNCFGSDTNFCCGNDPSGRAACVAGAWMCGSSLAPGCNGRSCLLRPDAD